MSESKEKTKNTTWMPELKWSYARHLADSAIVKSSYIWLLVVPIAAKLLSNTEGSLGVIIFGETVDVPLSLPFSWQLFFYAAIVFSCANVIYTIRCPKTLKAYRSFQEYEKQGRDPLELSLEFKELVFTPKYELRDDDQKAIANNFVRNFSRVQMPPNGEFLDDLDIAKAFHSPNFNMKHPQAKTAFYMTQRIAEYYNKKSIISALSLYALGLGLMLIIAGQNIWYVINT
ncbi:MAG: hypothetical protein MJK10_03890 [Pseudomonadales bacterium]|nr:hypothetical protein [Pseudomonadales bacterium]NRA15213.1 hypothetical protein [Oceanospirillaceae bacterium]